MTTQKGQTLYIHILNNVEDGQIFLPLTGKKLKKVEAFAEGTQLKFKQEKDGVRIFLPTQPETVDFVLTATMK